MPLTRRIRLAVLPVALSMVLAACGGGASNSSAPASPCDTSEDFPSRPIELIVPWAAGGGTDSVARFVGTQLAERLDTQVNVVNRTGGGGVVGHSAIATARPDGTTIGMATVEITMMHWQGLTDLTFEQLTPIGLVNSDPAGVTVRTDAPWADVQQLLAEAKTQPGATTASGTGRGGIWDLARAGMLLEVALPPDAIRWVPSEGAAPALQELVAGGVHVSTASLVENRTMIEAGRAKALAVMAEERLPNFPDVPTLREQGIDFTMAAWRGIAGPEGLPEDVVGELGCHLDGIVHSPAYEEFMRTAGFGIVWRGPQDFGAYLAQQDAEKGEIMRAAGLTG
ncbi:tripartite tricarboxylate transporter substrate binding protein [Pseudonocardia cypriaca]|uniref:Tripartite-type tricarboxylate transporter receptor subunit TctC n=1 Tax=Pseudonocardia cypriaca TaxID=882449 RepID=A0A543FWV4_9PSEU|nr:tripartite tricarboxylate transporter substrate binding protein [Pseudonocardia cypriaca]TQM38325.1 tripartite-type tricarboxylate transporter receptor subunit TctC [Pseudonocardia cypriaca]